jgi:hypothetical protein
MYCNQLSHYITARAAMWTAEHVRPPDTHHAGHSATSGAAAAVLAKFFGKDSVKFTIGTEFPGLSPRNYSSFTQVQQSRAALRRK